MRIDPWKLGIVALSTVLVLDFATTAEAEPVRWPRTGQGVYVNGAMMQAVAYAATQRALAPAPTPLPTADHSLPLPAWMPAGVLTHEATIHQVAAETGLDPLALAILVAIECPSGNTGCQSYAGARGLAQIMPMTASTLQQQTGHPCLVSPFDPATSLRCGAAYYIQGLRAAAAIWRPNREQDAIGAAGIGYNGGNGLIPRVVSHVQAGGYVCEAPATPAESRRWCEMALGMWKDAGRQ